MTTRGSSKSKASDAAENVDQGDALTVDEAGAEAARAEQAAEYETALHRRRVQYGEYGQWVAAFDLHDDTGTLVYATGHPVPVDQVDGETRRVVLTRHRCHHTPDVRCEKFNAPEMWSEPDAVERPANFEAEGE